MALDLITLDDHLDKHFQGIVLKDHGYAVFSVAHERISEFPITQCLDRAQHHGGRDLERRADMIVVFGGFCFGNFLLIKMLGFTLAAAALIDVTLVRLVIGPALFALAGGWNWWPRS